MKRLLKLDFVRFCIVGASGFTINFVLLSLLYKVAGAPLFLSQLIASEFALFSNFVLHHYWTYKHNFVAKRKRVLVVQFHATSWAAIIGSALFVSLFVHAFKMNYVAALIISSALALGWNFGWSKFVIWRGTAKEAEESKP